MKLTVADYLDQADGKKVLITDNDTAAPKVPQKTTLKYKVCQDVILAYY